MDEETQKYFKPFDWKAKGVVRKRFEAVHRPRYFKKGYSLADFKQKLSDLKQNMKELEKVIGPLEEMRMAFNEQQLRYNFFAKPSTYYKEFFLI